MREGLDGIVRAREDGTLEQLLADLVADGLAPTASGWAAAASDFVAERRRQYGALRLDLDHAMRGALNAMSLAAAVQRQSGADTTEMVARQAARLLGCLDRARRLVIEPDDRAVRPDAFEPSDVGRLVRDVVAEWNADGSRRRAAMVRADAAMARVDAGRIREAVLAMLEQVDAIDRIDGIDAVHAIDTRGTDDQNIGTDPTDPTDAHGPSDRPLHVSVTREPDGEGSAIVVVLDGPGDRRVDDGDGERARARRRLAQTAAAHGGDVAALEPDEVASAHGHRLRIGSGRA